MKAAKLRLLHGKHHVGKDVYKPGDTFEVRCESDAELAHAIERHCVNGRAEVLSHPTNVAPKTEAAATKSRKSAEELALDT